MDFQTPPATAAILQRIREFLARHVLPQEAAILRRGFGKSHGDLQKLRAEVKAAGLWGPQLATSLGGLGLPLLDHGLVSEVLGYSPLGHYLFGCQAPDAGNIEILEKHGTDEQKALYLRPLAAGEIRSCFAMTEPDSAGSNPTLLTCAARREGAHYVIDGRKWFTSSAEGAAFSIVMAITDPAADRHSRATMIIVPTDTPGFRLVRNIPIFGHAGSGYDSHAEIAFERCKVPLSNRLGPEGMGFVIAQERLGPGRIHHCMRWLGICRRAFDMLCDRANRRLLAPDKRLADKQIVQAWIAECKAKIEAARLLTLNAAWTIDNHGFEAAREQVSLIKFYVAEVMGEVLDRSIQAHGALGITDDTVLSFFYTRERGARIYDGPDEVHKMVVARRILRAYQPQSDSEPGR